MKKFYFSMLFLLFMVSVVFSSVPTKLSYQGILKNSSGSALTGSYNMRFSITSDSAGNSVVWGPESHDSVSVASGIFSVMLGETTALTPSVFSNDTRYIKVEVATPSDSTNYETMSPLTQVLSVGYALRAATAESVVDGSILEASIADGSVSNAKISDGTITNTKAASGNFVKQIVAGNNISISSTEANGTGIITITAEVNSGTLTRVNSGAGLTGGPVTSSGTLEVKYDNSTIDLDGTGSLEVKALGITRAKVANDNFVKQIVAGNNISISSTEADGTGIITISAESTGGTVTSVSSGAGLFGGPVTGVGTLEVRYDNSTIDLDVSGSLEVKNSGIATDKIANLAVTAPKIAAGNPIGGYYLRYTGTTLQWATIESVTGSFEVDYQTIGFTGENSLEVINLGISAGKIANSAVTSDKIDNLAVINAKIANGTIDLTSKATYVPVNKTGDNITLTQSGQTIEVSSSSPSGTLTGSGTTNYVSKFTGASALGTSTIYDNGTNIGIGTAEPVASFEVAGGILSQGTKGDTPVTGAGTRLMWIPAKGAFRSGTVDGAQWDTIGTNSFAVGNNTTASGNYSTAMGFYSIASGTYSTAMGYGATAGGLASVAIRIGTTTSGNFSTAMGYNTTAIGISSVAAGQFLTAEADNTIVLGKGFDNTSRLNNNKANSLMVGFGGTSPILYASGEAVNGMVGIGTTEPTSKLTVAGTVEMILGSNGTLKFADGTNQTTAYTGNSNAGGWIKSGSTITSEVGINKFGVGEGAIASANNSVAIGSGNTASGISSVAMGLNSLASNTTSISIGNGTEASGLSSVALGYTTTAGGNYSTALGYFTTTGKDYSTAIGTYLTTEAIDTIVLGKGIGSDNPLRNNKANSLMVGFGGTSPILYASGEAVNGRVGIGTTAPTSKLTVAGTVEMILGSNGTLKFADGTNQTTAYTGVSASAGWIKSGSIITVESSVNKVGIGTAEPAASFEVSGGILSQGTNGITPVSGAGTRFMWIPSKNAFRAGSVDGNQWNSSNVGTNSFAEGFNTKASGNMSVALGDTTTADASSAVAFGYHALASNFASVALGNGTTASGNSSTAMGESAIASGARSTAMGFDTRASNTGSTAMGDSTIASGEYSVAMGRSTIASGEYSTAMGLATEANNTGSTAMGGHSKANGISSTAMGSYTEANGNYSFAIGDSATAVGDASFAAGQYLTTEANYTIVLGRGIGSLTSQRLKNNIANSLMVGFGGTSPILFVSGEATNGKVGVGTTEPTAKLQVDSATGYNQLRMVKSYTPGDSSTATGNVGDIAWDSNYIYIKTNDGWKRSNLIAF